MIYHLFFKSIPIGLPCKFICCIQLFSCSSMFPSWSLNILPGLFPRLFPGQFPGLKRGKAKIIILTETKFLVPVWRRKSTLAWGCRTGLRAYVSWRAGTTTLCRSQLYHPRQRLRIRLLYISSLESEEEDPSLLSASTVFQISDPDHVKQYPMKWNEIP